AGAPPPPPAPPAAPVTPAAAPPAPRPPTPTPTPPTPTPPVLADGHYDSYVRTVDRSHDRLVVDLGQGFHDPAAGHAALAHTHHRAGRPGSVHLYPHPEPAATAPAAGPPAASGPACRRLRSACQQAAQHAGRPCPRRTLLLHPDGRRWRRAADQGAAVLAGMLSS